MATDRRDATGSSSEATRRDSWQREDVAEESAVEGSRKDVGLSGGMSESKREGPGFERSRGVAGSLSDAASETGVSEETPSFPRPQERSR
jgi:hypothetical protein